MEKLKWKLSALSRQTSGGGLVQCLEFAGFARNSHEASNCDHGILN